MYERVSNVMVKKGHIELNLITDVKPLMDVENKLWELMNSTKDNCHSECEIYLENMQSKLDELKFISDTDSLIL